MTPSPTRPWSVATVARHLLLLAVALGLTAMHVMAAGTGSEHGHGAAEARVVTTTAPVHAGEHDLVPMTPASGSAAGGDGGAGSGGHGGAGACVLFVATGLVLLAALVGLVLGRRRARVLLGDLRHRAVAHFTGRAPPGRWRPRVALCVIRV